MSIDLSKCPACQHEKHLGKACGVEYGRREVGGELETVHCKCDDSQARKADAGKTSCFNLLPWLSIEELAGIYEYGARKYAPNSWRQVPDGAQRYGDAMMRHLSAHFRGEVLDPESGLRHLAHAFWNLAAVMELTRDK